MDNGSEHVTVQNDSFWQALMSGGQKPFQRRSVRLISLALVTVCTIAFVLYSAVYYVQNVLLVKPEIQINRFGTFIRKSYNSEYAMFLYDPSEAWAASGIQVQKGDRLFISASGAYHTNYTELIDATENNHWADVRQQIIANEGRAALNNKAVIDKLQLYRYIDMSIPPDSIVPNKPLYIDRKNLKVAQPKHLKDSALFGDVLMQIVPENKMRDTLYQEEGCIYALPRMQKNVKECLVVDNDGVITFGVNDFRPSNNVGQILVVMEIYRNATGKKAAMKLLSGQLIDWPYYWYDYWCHSGWCRPLAALVFVLWVMVEFLILCFLLYSVPFLFLKETWTKLLKSKHKHT